MSVGPRSLFLTFTTPRIQASTMDFAPDLDVAVIGGGFSGLYAAHSILARAPDLKVCVVEGSGRLGGRVVTRRFPDGTVLELGPSFTGLPPGVEDVPELWENPHIHGLLREFELREPQINDFPRHLRSVNVFRDPAAGPEDDGCVSCRAWPFTGTVRDEDMVLAFTRDFDEQLVKGGLLDAEGGPGPLFDTPWDSPLIAQLDQLSIADFAQMDDQTRPLAPVLGMFVRTVLSQEPENVSMGFFTYYVARCGGLTAMTSSVEQGPDSRRVWEGLEVVIDRLAEAIRARGGVIRLAAPLVRVASAGDHLALELSDGDTLTCRRLIVALPPHLCSGIAFDLGADAQAAVERRVELGRDMVMGRMYKGYVRYPTEWWSRYATTPPPPGGAPVQDCTARTQCFDTLGDALTCSPEDAVEPMSSDCWGDGYTGYSNGDCTFINWTMPSGWRHEGDGDEGGDGDDAGVANPALMWFVVGDKADALRAMSPEDRRRAVLESLRSLFFAAAPDKPLELVEIDWYEEPCGGGPTSTMPPGLLTRLGPSLRAPAGAVHWAGTETARRFGGYIEGALEAGARAASEVLTALGLEG